jgi:uncharacterized protein YndB with AHSA1/START domain
MKINYEAQNPVSAEAVRKATGKSWDEWFTLLDKFGGPAKGRKAINEFLYSKHKVDAWWTTTLVVEYEKARKVTEKDGHAKGYTICATKAIKAKPQELFEAFAKPATLAKWFGAGTKMDFREGGAFSNPDGNRGQMKKINPGKVLRFTWEGEQHAPVEMVEVKFQPSGAKCTVMITHDRLQSRETADGMRAAWGAALDTLKSQFESGR